MKERESVCSSLVCSLGPQIIFSVQFWDDLDVDDFILCPGRTCNGHMILFVCCAVEPLAVVGE